MGRGRDVSAFDRGQIVGARKAGCSISATAKLLGFPRQTVASVYQDYVKSGKTANNRDKCGRKRAVDARGERRLGRIVTTNRTSTVQQITSQFNEGAATSLCSKTIRRSMAQIGFGSRRPHRVPMLTARHRKMRLQFAQAHRSWSVDEWKRVIWSDESRFRLYHADGRLRVWRRPHEAMDPACQVGVLQAGGGGITVWAAFTWSALGPLVPLETSVTGSSYVQLLADHLHTFVTWFCPNNDGIFQHDNAPPHRSRLATNWLWEHASEFTTLEWPPNSPDINPIENLWDVLEKAVRERQPPPASVPALRQALLDSWAAIPPSVFQNLIGSLPRRLAAVVRAKGGATRY